MSSGGAVYCMDCSSLLHAAKRAYPQRRFPRLWTAIDNLISGGRLVMSIEAYRELEKKDDEVFDWAKGRKLYGHLYDDLLKLKYLHQRYTNYLRWLKTQ